MIAVLYFLACSGGAAADGAPTSPPSVVLIEAEPADDLGTIAEPIDEAPASDEVPAEQAPQSSSPEQNTEDLSGGEVEADAPDESVEIISGLLNEVRADIAHPPHLPPRPIVRLADEVLAFVSWLVTAVGFWSSSTVRRGRSYSTCASTSTLAQHRRRPSAAAPQSSCRRKQSRAYVRS